jgi:hypothetical protein
MERRNRRFRRLNSTGTQAVGFQVPLARRFSWSVRSSVVAVCVNLIQDRCDGLIQDHFGAG